MKKRWEIIVHSKNRMLDTQNRLYQSSLRRAFILTLFFVTLASGLFWLDFFRSYKTDISLLVISRSNNESSQVVASNIAELIGTLSFYNRLIDESDTLDDTFATLTPDRRKVEWNNIVSVSQKTESGVVVIHAKGKTIEESKRIAEETTRTLFSVVGLYYTIEKDISVRVIDGPIVSYTLENRWMYIFVVLLSGISMTYFFFFLLKRVPEFFLLKKRAENAFHNFSPLQNTDTEETSNHFAYESHHSEEVPFIDPRKFVPEKPETFVFTHEKEEKLSETFVSTYTKHASAPINLPIALDERDLPFVDDISSLPFTFETDTKENNTKEGAIVASDNTVSEVSEEQIQTSSEQEEETSNQSSAEIEEKETPITEPTSEDYKRRLNELLSDTTK